MRIALAVALLVASSTAFAEADWFASLYTGEGTELRADERVFTLYALMNAMGYSKAPITRQHPLPKYEFHAVRKDVRLKLLSTDPAVRREADTFFDAHPVPLSRYLAYAVTSDAPPFNAGSKIKELQDLRGLEGLLKSAYTKWNLADLMGQVQLEYRKALKAYLTAIDGPMAKAKKLLKVPDDAPPSLLVLNLLDAHNEVQGVMGQGEVVLVVGPSDKPNVEGVVREYARVFLESAVGKKAQASWPGGPGLLREAQLLGVQEGNVGDYATALVTRAVALKATDAPDAAYEAAGQAGYFGLKEISQRFDDGKPIDSWLLDALARAETRRPPQKK